MRKRGGVRSMEKKLLKIFLYAFLFVMVTKSNYVFASASEYYFCASDKKITTQVSESYIESIMKTEFKVGENVYINLSGSANIGNIMVELCKEDETCVEAIYQYDQQYFYSHCFTIREVGDYYLRVLIESEGYDKKYYFTVKAVPLEIVSSPSQRSVRIGDSSTFFVFARGSNLSYQWVYNTTGTTTSWVEIDGATGDTYKIRESEMTSSYDGRYYFCRVTDGDSYVSSTPAKLTVYAQIDYDANGGKDAPASQMKYRGNNITLSNTVPTRTGYDFLGWSASSMATTADSSYALGSTYSTDANLTLYAVWKNKEYQIKYDANGGTGTLSDQVKRYGESVTISPQVPTKTGSIFDGWATSSTATTAEYKSGDIYSKDGDVTLYAVWRNATSGISDSSVHVVDRNGEINESDNSDVANRKKTIITAKSKINVAYGSKDSVLDVKVNSDGKLTYQTSNDKVITVDKNGRITVKGYGKAVITIKVSKTSEYKAATKKIKILIVPDEVKKFKVKSNSSGGVSFSWKKVNDKNAKCQIQASPTSDFSDTKSIPDKAMKLGKLVNIRGLTRGRVWYFRSRVAVNVSGKTYYSGWVVRKVKIK